MARTSAGADSPIRPALERLHAIAVDLLKAKPMVINIWVNPSEVEALLRQISSDETAIRRVLRRFRKLARGPLHPANLLLRLARPGGES